MRNMIQTSLPANDRTTILDLIDQLETILTGKLTALTEEERVRFGSINEQNKLLVNKVREYRQNSPNMSTPDVDWTEFEADYQTRVFLDAASNRLKSLVYQMQSTKIMHDHDNYQDALSDYAYAQYKKGAGEPGFTEKVAEIKQFFNRTGSAAPAPPPPNPENNG
jgi:hypothetical protein